MCSTTLNTLEISKISKLCNNTHSPNKQENADQTRRHIFAHQVERIQRIYNIQSGKGVKEKHSLTLWMQ